MLRPVRSAINIHSLLLRHKLCDTKAWTGGILEAKGWFNMLFPPFVDDFG